MNLSTTFLLSLTNFLNFSSDTVLKPTFFLFSSFDVSKSASSESFLSVLNLIFLDLILYNFHLLSLNLNLAIDSPNPFEWRPD